MWMMLLTCSFWKLAKWSKGWKELKDIEKIYYITYLRFISNFNKKVEPIVKRQHTSLKNLNVPITDSIKIWTS